MQTLNKMPLQVSDKEGGLAAGLGTKLTTLIFGRCLRLLPAALLLAGAAQAQSHSTESGSYVLRSTTVASEQIDAEAARRPGVVPAHVTVSMRPMSSYSSNIKMREVRECGDISYLGSYKFLPRQVINFEGLAAPTEDAPRFA